MTLDLKVEIDVDLSMLNHRLLQRYFDVDFALNYVLLMCRNYVLKPTVYSVEMTLDLKIETSILYCIIVCNETSTLSFR